MEINEANKTLEWLDGVQIKSFDNAENLVLECNAGAGGPGEDVTLYIEFKHVCYVNIPVGFNVSTCILINAAPLAYAKQLLPPEYSFDDNEYNTTDLCLYYFSDGDLKLPYFILSYGLNIWQTPTDWSGPDSYK